MKLYTSVGPNPRVLRMFMAERGVELETVDVDIIGGENLTDEYKARNPGAQSPCLEMDDGSVLSEITVICNYLDEVSPGPSLVGDTPEQRAETRMWNRRFDAKILEPMTTAFRSAEAIGLFENRCHVMPDAAKDLKEIVQESYAWLEPLMAGKEFVCGDRFTLADIQLYCFVDFGTSVGQTLPADLPNLQAWFTRMSERPSVPLGFHAQELAQAE
ncbi:MAG: glutathione S-transferase family protein [Halioglobus sp.]